MIFFDKIPAELKAKKQWVLWKLIQKKGQEKLVKVPFQINSRPAKTNDPDTWNTFDSVAEAFKTGCYAGIGFVFNRDFIGIDIDNCVNDGIPKEIGYWIETFASYTEYSQSGKGLHIIVRGDRLPGTAKQSKPFEIYSENRYFALTGDLVSEKFATIQTNDLAVKEFYLANIGNESKPEPKKYSEYPQNPEIQSSVIEVLANSNCCNDFDSWKRIAMAFKSAGLSYDQVDQVFATGAGYNRKENEYLYSKMRPTSITFGTAYHAAKIANPTLLAEKLKAYKSTNAHISESIPKDKVAQNSIFERDGKTFIVKTKKGKGSACDEIFDIEIAAFTTEIRKKISDDNKEISWEIELRSTFDTEIIDVENSVFVNIQQFKETIAKKGVFLYHVTDTATHNQFIDFVLRKSRFGKSKKTKYLGMIEEGFLFHNALVSRDGIVSKIEESGIIPPKPEIAKKMLLNESLLFEDGKTFIEKMQDVMGEQIWKAIGFSVASLFQDSIVEQFGQFPIAFFYGKHHTGKSTVAKILQSFLGMLQAVGETGFATQKAWQRIGSKFKNGIVILNEFRSNENSNTLLCQLHDREGYNRAKKDVSLDTESIEINSSYIVLSTQNIVGVKAEDAHSRIVELDSDAFLQNQTSMAWLKKFMTRFSSFLPTVLAKIKGNELVNEIENVVNQLREQTACEDRIVVNHAILLTSYNLFCDAFQCDRTIDQSVAIQQIAMQASTTKENDLGNTFLAHLASIVRNDDIKACLATINKNGDEETLIFRLQDCLPMVRKLGKQADCNISDKTTIEKSLRLLGCELKTTRALGSTPVKAWHYIMQEDK